MLKKEKSKELYFETDESLSRKFAEAGMGFGTERGQLFHPLEAAYLVSLGKAQMEGQSAAQSPLPQKKSGKLFPFAFAVYSSIRSAGRLVRPYAEKTHYLRAYAPGVGREQERPSQLIALLPGKTPSAKTLSEEVRVAHLARLDLIIATGSEKEIKFYKVSAFNF